jgi:hypothetical protein
LSNRRFSKKLIFTYYSVLTDFCHYLHLPLDLFLFEFFWSEEILEEVVTVDNVLMDVVLELKLNQKWIYYLAYSNVANENCVKFCIQKVFKCRERRMTRWDKVWTKAQAWGCPCHPRKYPRSTSVEAWGCPRHPLLHQQKYQIIFQATIFLLLHMLCVFLGASLFLFSVLFCFVCCNKWLDHIIFVLERDTLRFLCLEHSSFHHPVHPQLGIPVDAQVLQWPWWRDATVLTTLC